MSQTSWTNQEGISVGQSRGKTTQFVVAAVLLVAAIIFVVYNALNSAGGTQLYVTVNEYLAQESSLTGRDVRVTGWVIGDSIQYTQIDESNSRLEFDIVDDLANPTQRLHIVALNEPKPDLLQHEAQALVEGRAGSDQTFVANQNGLLLKCPTRYEGDEPVLNPQTDA